MTGIYFADILGLGTPELIIILVILLLLFGAKKLPELARSLGSSAGELKKGMDDAGKAKPKSTNVDVDKKVQ
jgi:sec-independent protein translocase protein TatA